MSAKPTRDSTGAPAPRFPEITVVLGDPKLPDVTKVGARYSHEDLEAVDRMRAALSVLVEYRFDYWSDHGRLVSDLLERRPSFVLNFCDTGLRNVAAMELHVPALLEAFDIPYSGSPPGCLSRCFDKSLVRSLAAATGVAVPDERFLRHADRAFDLPDSYPVIIKPNTGDGSIGITQGSVARDAGAAQEGIEALRDQLPGRDILVQEFLEGPEYGLCLIGNPEDGFEVLPPLEVDYSGLDARLPRILGYESKTIPESPYWKDLRFRRAELSASQLERLVRGSEALFERLGLRDYGRFDFRTDARGEIKLLEVNPNPSWCWDGKMNFMAGFAGYSESELFRRLIETAERRYT